MDTPQLLDLLAQPAFRVTGGVISYVNPAAAGCLLEPGTPIRELLAQDYPEYEALTQGSLYLSLALASRLVGACVTRTEAGDIFLLEEVQDPALQALSLAAKELRVPLAGLMAAAERLLPELSGENPQDAARINRSLHQLLRRIGNMSDAARYTADPTGNRELRDICALLDEIFEKAGALAEQAGVTIRYQPCPQRCLCSVDSELLERAVYNLLSNAIRFSPAGATIQASVTRRGNRLSLTVSDPGSGIPGALQSSLFRRYRRQPGFEDSRHGLGLGMVLVRAAAAAHGGTVLVQQHSGTRITVTFSLSTPTGELRSPILRVDYTGARDHGLIELSDILPEDAYRY